MKLENICYEEVLSLFLLFFYFLTLTLILQFLNLSHDLNNKINVISKHPKANKTHQNITWSLDGLPLPDLDSTQKVVISPLPLTSILPLSLVVKEAGKRFLVASETWIIWASPKDIILDEVFMASPNKQYLGHLFPTMPATTIPLWLPS